MGICSKNRSCGGRCKRGGYSNRQQHAGKVWFDDVKIVKGNTARTVIVSESNYYPFGLKHKGYNNVINGVENNYKTYQGQELHKELGLDAHEFKFRFYYSDIGRFWSIDPLADGYVYNSPYNFAENSVIANYELEGLEAKLAIYGDGSGTNYTSSDRNAFHARASSLEKNNGYNAEKVNNGQALISALKTATADEGSVQSAVIFAHGSGAGLFLDPGAGFYANKSTNPNSATVSDIAQGVKDGSIVFEDNATIVFGSCHACGAGASPPLAKKITEETGVTTIGATGFVEPEIKNGKETGKLTTTGTFTKTEKVFDISFTDGNGKVLETKTVKNMSEAINAALSSDKKVIHMKTINSRIVQTDLGDTIDPSKL
ncbi:MAG: hypothetical protein GKR88_11500 [Flavobacteriaceae bacterium]|nr:MAG: hypothetical protein GKR88_11500 [Flavobacteriaceae bacterium]